jgi:hypothetical protein
MSLTGTFNLAASPAYRKLRKKRPAPFSLRLSQDERARLAMEAAGAPLGAYIKAKLLDGPPPVVPRQARASGLPMRDRQAFAQALGLLGKSRLSSNLNQIARLANIGALPLNPEVEAELITALREVRSIRALLLAALGLKLDAAS